MNSGHISTQVDDLKVVLAVQEVDLKQKNEIADKILAEVRAENTKAEAEKAFGNENVHHRRGISTKVIFSLSITI